MGKRTGSKSKQQWFNSSSGDRVKVKINWVDSGKQRISLTLIDIVAEDAGDWVEGTSIPR